MCKMRVRRRLKRRLRQRMSNRSTLMIKSGSVHHPCHVQIRRKTSHARRFFLACSPHYAHVRMRKTTSSPPMRPTEVLSAVDGSELSNNFDPPREANAVSLSKKGRHSRSNTAEEKRRMRKDRIGRNKTRFQVGKTQKQSCSAAV